MSPFVPSRLIACLPEAAVNFACCPRNARISQRSFARIYSRTAAADRLFKNFDEECSRWLTFLLGPFTKPIVQPRSDSHLEAWDVGGLVLPIGDHPARGCRKTLFGLVEIGWWIGYRRPPNFRCRNRIVIAPPAVSRWTRGPVGPKVSLP
jgi:hypothetical protein